MWAQGLMVPYLGGWRCGIMSARGWPHHPRDLREPQARYSHTSVPLGQPLEKLDLRLFSKLKEEAVLGSSYDTAYHFSLVLRDQEVKFKVRCMRPREMSGRVKRQDRDSERRRGHVSYSCGI